MDVAKHPQDDHIRAEINDFVARLGIPPWDDVAEDCFRSLCAYFEVHGTFIGNMDMIIAAHAVSLEIMLVSNNARHFKK
ncbi:putative nucleic acid-binding protein [Methylocaldum sp. RMAD-M]|jgi:tRNA(fMet)-specific endonuclease VapC|nr:putative nucleic acid-binding protein [Methylocaldum sp. RMAD-M]